MPDHHHTAMDWHAASAGAETVHVPRPSQPSNVSQLRAKQQDTERLRKIIIAGSSASNFPSTPSARRRVPSPSSRLGQRRPESAAGLRRDTYSHQPNQTPSPFTVSRPRKPEPEAAAAASRRSQSSSQGSASGPGDGPEGSAGGDKNTSTTPVLSFWGPDPVPLPSRFAGIKRNLIAGHEAELEASWTRLLAAIRTEVEQIEGLGAHLIPSIEFTDLDESAQTLRFGRDLRRYGVGVVRKVVPRADVDGCVQDTIRYVDAQRRRGGPASRGIGSGVGAGYPASDAGPVRPSSTSTATSSSSSVGAAGLTSVSSLSPATDPRIQIDDASLSVRAPRYDPACFNLFWTPAQVRTRAHPNVRRAQQFMMSLWETRPDDQMAPQTPITYADRIRIYGSGPGAGVSPTSYGLSRGEIPRLSTLSQPPVQSPDDWINALQSSAGIIAQVDNGSLERWEPDGYQRAGTYDRIFQGRWEEYDPWVSACRVSANTDLYNGYGACTIFRMFQGVLALSTIEPGMIRLLPSPKLATAYYLLRPFFTPTRSAPEWPSLSKSGRTAEWDVYLSPDNWHLKREPDTIIHGAVPGHAQRITERWHPHLQLRSSMITLPTLQPGDYILWHPDLPYHLSSGESSHVTSLHGLETPRTPETCLDDLRMLVYVPAAPLTQTSALYLARQRKAYQRGQPGPDFDSSGRSNFVEDPDVRPDEAEISRVGGQAALKGMGLLPWDEDGGGGSSTPTTPTAETEVVRLANIILFPDQIMMG